MLDFLGDRTLKIRMLVNGHRTQEYKLEYAKKILVELSEENIIIDDDTKQLAEIQLLTEKSAVSIYPKVGGG